MNRLVSAAVVAVALLGLPHAAAAQNASIDSARANLAKYKDPMAALADGYLSTVMCMDFPHADKAGETAFQPGAMGVHFLNLGTIGKPLDAAKPQVVIYEPHGDTLRLVGVEWFVPVEASATQPQLFGRGFDGPMDGHPPIMPVSLRHWDLHVWLWRTNPAGIFSPTNAAVRCPASVNTYRAPHPHN